MCLSVSGGERKAKEERGRKSKRERSKGVEEGHEERGRKKQ